MSRTLKMKYFRDIDVDDSFFDSLKAQYKEFPSWFKRKKGEKAYIVEEATGKISGFVYLKIETGSIEDVSPILPPARRIKVGTLKIEAKGTKLGERIMKKIFDHAMKEQAEEIYVTVFDTHEALINLFTKYGFTEKGNKTTANGRELVFLRSLKSFFGDQTKDYPLIQIKNRSIYLLAIYPEYHTKLFPDSILVTESPDIVQDLSHTNSIHKAYIAKIPLTRMKKGDVVVMYRTTDRPGHARFRSVATSICVIEEAKSRKDFSNFSSFLKYAEKHSVFTKEELKEQYDKFSRLFIIKMTYNVSLNKRPIRRDLLDIVGIPLQPRWDLKKITEMQFRKILEMGQVDENFIVN